MTDADQVDRTAAGRILLLQLGGHERAREIVGNKAADDAGFEDVVAHLVDARRRGRETGRDHVTGLDAAFDDLHVAGIGGPQRLDPGAVDAGDEEDVVGRRLQGREIARRPHVPVVGEHADKDAVGSAELLLVLDIGPHVLV